ncbi:MAG: YbhN family protein [Candidatus Caccovivens sp.]
MDENEKVELNTQQPDKKQSFFSRLKNKRKQKLAMLQNQQLSEEETKKVEEKIEEANKEVSESSGKKKKIKNILFFIFNIVLVAGILVWNIFSSDEFTPLKLLDINLLYVFIVLLFLAFIMFVDVCSIQRMIYRKTMRSRWNLSYKSLAILRYYDAVTPLSTGGQAFMVTYLTARDVPGATSLSIPIAKLIFQNISWLLVTFVCLIVSFTNGMSTTFVSATSIIGFVLAFLMIAIILFLSFSKKLGRKLVSGGLKLLVKMRILKDYDKHYNKVLSFVEDYQNIMKEYSKSKLDIIYQFVLHISRFIFMYSIPFFIYCAFMGFDGSKFGEFFMYTALIDLASSFIPLPGGTGMNEITFTVLFNRYLGGATFWALLLWRFCSYYFYLLQGLGILMYDTIYGNRKYRWVKKRFDLQEESQEFKRLQIENFRQERNKRRKQQKKSKITE